MIKRRQVTEVKLKQRDANKNRQEKTAHVKVTAWLFYFYET